MQIVWMKHYIINLTEEEREELNRLTKTGRHSALRMLHARILLKTDEGLADEEVAEHLDVNTCAQSSVYANGVQSKGSVPR